RRGTDAELLGNAALDFGDGDLDHHLVAAPDGDGVDHHAGSAPGGAVDAGFSAFGEAFGDVEGGLHVARRLDFSGQDDRIVDGPRENSGMGQGSLENVLQLPDV